MPAAIGLALFQLGAPLFVVNAVTLGVGATLINTAIGVGLSLAASAVLTPQAASLSPSDGQQRITQAVPPRWKHYGEKRIAGPVFWFESKESQKIFYLGLALNQGRIGSISNFHIDDKIVLLGAGEQVAQAPYSSVTTRLFTHLGLPVESSYSVLNSAFNYPRIRGDGVATILGMFQTFGNAADQAENYPNGKPNLRVTMKASVVWDFREAAQIRTDDTTWQWSENPVVCLLDYLLSADGFGLSWDRISGNIAAWEIAADICDETLWSIEDSHFEPRYRIAATYVFDENPSDIVARFARIFDGRIWQQRDGTIGITAGKFTRPTITLDEQSILLFDIERGEDRLMAVAGIRAQYLSHFDDYRQQDATPWPDGDTVLALSDDRVANLDLTWAPSHSQARRLMEREYERANAKWNGQIVTSLSGLRVIDERFVHLKISELGIDDDFEIDHYTINLERMEVAIDVRSAAAISDPVRPAFGTSGLFYRGSGIVKSTDSDPSMNFRTVLDGVAPVAGDLVIFAIRSRISVSWANPVGWTVVNTEFGDSANFDLFRQVSQGDIDSPRTPISLAEFTLMHWIAFNPAATGSPSVDLYEDIGVDVVGNPEPVKADATGLDVPFILISVHASKANVPFEAQWNGAKPDFIMRDQFDDEVGQTVFFKVYAEGAGDLVRADMHDAGDLNFQRIYAVKYT